MSSGNYDDADAASDPEENDEEVNEEEEEEEGSAGSDEEQDAAGTNAEPHEDYDALDDTPAPKPFPEFITLLLPRRDTPGAACEPTRVHVCLTRGMIGRLPPRGTGDEEEDDEEGDDEDDDNDDHAGAAGAPAPDAEVAEEGEEEEGDGEATTAAAALQGCCAGNHHYELDYAVPLATLRRRLILRHLHGDSERQRRFLLYERAREQRKQKSGDGNAAGNVDDDGGDDAGADDDDGAAAAAEKDGSVNPLDGVVWPWTTVQQPPPYWLPALLSNDVHAFQRVLRIMYGWIIAPDPHPSDKLQLDAAGRLCTGTPVLEAEEDDEDAEQADPAHHNADFFLASGAFRGEDEEKSGDAGNEESDNSISNPESAAPAPHTSKSLLGAFNEVEEEEVEAEPRSDEEAPQQEEEPHDGPPCPDGPGRSRALLSIATAPPPVVALPYFPFAEYEFYIAYDAVSKEWHLLDTHPLLVMHACQRRRAEQAVAGGGEPADEEEAAGAATGGGGGEEDEAAGDASSEEDGSENQAERVGGLHVPKYALDTLVPVSPVVLAALFSPAALRCALLQPVQAAARGEEDGGDEAGAAGGDDDDDGDDGADGGAAASARGVSSHAVLRTFDAAWLSVDLSVALPILATICRARQRVLQQDSLRIPYTLGSIWLDVNPLFALPNFADVASVATAEEVRQWRVLPGQHPEEEEEEAGDVDDVAAASPTKAMELSAPHRWGSALDKVVDPIRYGRLVLTSLLDAGLLPTRPVELVLFQRLCLLRLALWWWMRLPPASLRGWGVDAAAQHAEASDDEEEDAEASGEDAASGEGRDGDGGAEEEDLAAMTVEDATDVLRQRIDAMRRRDARARRLRLRRTHPTLQFSPLLLRVLLELQRRLDRLNAVNASGASVTPSQYTLQESVARTFAAELLESGRPRQDPLVTAEFVGLASTASRTGGAADVAPSAPAHTPLVRHQRLYQSDLVLLLLAVTTTPAPLPSRAAVILDLAERRFTAATEDVVVGSGVAAAAEVSVRDAQSRDVDGHVDLFSQLLELKEMRCVRRPQDRARSGTTKLLLLCAVDFSRGAVRQRVFEHLPTFELFGSTGYCPLPELVQAWAISSAAARAATVQLFAYYMWSEVYWRQRKGQYDGAAVSRMRAQLPELFATIDDHVNSYRAVLAQLEADASSEGGDGGDQSMMELVSGAGSPPSGAAAAKQRPRVAPTPPTAMAAAAAAAGGAARRQRPSLISSAVLQATLEDERAEADHLTPTKSPPFAHSLPRLSASLAPTAPPLTLAHPNAYSAEVLESKSRVRLLWQSFLVAPHTYMTAETLHALLFGSEGRRGGDAEECAASGAHHFNTAALRVLFEHGITTVQACPLDGPETPAIEEALRRADLPAVKVLVGLGAASLQDVRLHGSATLESRAEQLFSAEEMDVLRFVALRNTRVSRADPRLQFGARRFGSVPASS